LIAAKLSYLKFEGIPPNAAPTAENINSGGIWQNRRFKTKW